MFSFLPFFACKPSSKLPVEPKAGFDWEGHRGCRGLMPENSIPAFVYALEIPEVVTLELDLAVSKDNQLIVSHEPWFNPDICLKPNGDSIKSKEGEKLLIYQFTAKEIQGYDCGTKAYARFPQQQRLKTYKPVFRDMVAALKQANPARAAKIRYNIEIKSQPDWDGIRHPAVAEFARMVIAEIKDLGIADRCVVQSFDIRALQEMHRQDPTITLAYLIENINSFDSNLQKLGFTPDIYSPYYLMVSKKLIRKCHTKGIKVIPWTVNDLKSMRGLIRLGVDGIITDYPNLIKEVRGE